MALAAPPLALPARPATDEDDDAGWRVNPRRAGLVATLDGETDPRFVLRVAPASVDLARPRPEPRSSRVSRELILALNQYKLGPVPVEVRPAAPLNPLPALPGSGHRLTARFHEGLPLSFVKDLHVLLEELRRRGCLAPALATPPVVETIDDPARIREILRALIAEGSEGVLLSRSAPPIPVRLLPPRPGDPRPLRALLQGPCPLRPQTLRIQGHVSAFDVPVVHPRTEGGELALGLPDTLRRLRHRESRRIRVRSGWEVAFQHPYWPDRVVRRPMHDISVHGLSFETPPADDLLIPGLVIDSLCLLNDGVPRLAVPARVRRMSPAVGAPGMVAGVRVEPADDAAFERWRAIAQDIMNPAARTRGTRPEHSWTLFQESGYFALSGCSPADFARKTRDFANATRRMDDAPDLGCQSVVPSDRGAECSSAVHRLYSGTYFAGQLAKRKGSLPGFSSRRILRDGHMRMYEHLQHDLDLRWILVYLHESTKWTQTAYRDFPRPHIARGDAWHHPIDAWVGRCDIAPRGRTPGLDIGPIVQGERALLARAAETSRCAAYVDALDLDVARQDLADLRRRWARVGLDREREIRVARVGGEPVAAVLLETAEPGLHLFDMYDTVRLYELAPGGAAFYGDLLAEAAAWYRARGRASFVYVREDQDETHARAAGLQSLGGALLLLMSRRILPDFLEVVHEMTAPGDVTLEEAHHVHVPAA
jgi:hypothetical protein